MAGPIQKKLTKLAASPLDLLTPKWFMGQYEQALGALVMRLSVFHFMLEIHMWSLLGISVRNGRVLTEDMPLTSLIGRLKRVAKTKLMPHDLDTLQRILNDLGKIIEKRNRLAHALWSFPDDGGVPSLLPKKGTLINEEAPPVSDMKNLVDSTESLLNEFMIKCLGSKTSGQLSSIPPQATSSSTLQ